jgi:hypothetical protein
MMIGILTANARGSRSHCLDTEAARKACATAGRLRVESPLFRGDERPACRKSPLKFRRPGGCGYFHRRQHRKLIADGIRLV